MRVFHFIDALRAGGKERQLALLVEGLRHAGVEVLLGVIDSHDSFEPNAVRDGVAYVPRVRRWDVSVFRRLATLIRGYRPHVIHTHDWMTSFYALPLAKALGIPLVNGSIRNSFSAPGIRWRAERALIRLSDAVIANSEAGLRSRGLERSSTRTVIHNGFDFGRLRHLTPGAAMRTQLGIDTRYVVGMVALFNRHKDHPTFVAAAQQVLARRDDVTFVAVGDGQTLEECKRAVATDCTRIRFPGLMENVESVANMFDVGVLASHGEGISNAIMEYMALGKPVVATDLGATNEVVVDGVTGLLVPPHDAAALASSVCAVLDNQALASRMGHAGRHRIEQHFSLARLTADTLAFYESVLGRSGRDATGLHHIDGDRRPVRL